MPVSVIARSEATKQSILSWRGKMDCFASLAMTEQGSGECDESNRPRGMERRRQDHLADAGDPAFAQKRPARFRHQARPPCLRCRRYRGHRGHDAAVGDAGRRPLGQRSLDQERSGGLIPHMAQLSDDCFAFGGPMMSVDEAVGLIAARVTPVRDVETVALVRADGRILAHDIAAPLPLPPFTNSAVDGYAVAGRDLPQNSEQAFPVTGRVQAGGSATAAVKPGQAMRIFTGAPMPDGTDTVFMQEDVRLEAGQVVLPAGLKPGANVRPAGEDIPAGHAALKAGQRLRPQDIALAAAFGLTQIDVVRRIRVAVFSTGNELVSPGEARGAAQLFDSNRFMLMAMLARLGCYVNH